MGLRILNVLQIALLFDEFESTLTSSNAFEIARGNYFFLPKFV
jgi:hypothetical protein